jgi:hypothetical protein
MNTLQTHNTKQEYLTVWLIGCITFLTSILVSLVFYYTVVPLIEHLERIISVTGVLLFLPLYVQICFFLLIITSLGAINGLCRWRKAPLTLNLLGSIPMLVMLLLYAIPQVTGDLHWTWDSIYLADRALLFVPLILFLTSYLLFILSTITLLRMLWI